jgi:hypothetical protein
MNRFSFLRLSSRWQTMKFHSVIAMSYCASRNQTVTKKSTTCSPTLHPIWNGGGRIVQRCLHMTLITSR